MRRPGSWKNDNKWHFIDIDTLSSKQEEWGGKERDDGEKENGRDLGWNCCDLKGVWVESDYKGNYMKTFSKNRWRIQGWRWWEKEGGACFVYDSRYIILSTFFIFPTCFNLFSFNKPHLILAKIHPEMIVLSPSSLSLTIIYLNPRKPCTATRPFTATTHPAARPSTARPPTPTRTS